jgi:Tfp pilus assembly protein PilO
VEPRNKDGAQGTPSKPAFSLKPTKQTCMVLGGAIGVILLGGGSLYAWQSGELATATTQTQAKRKELDDSNKIAKRRESVQDEYKSLQDKLRYLEDSVAPGTEFEATFLEQISKLALTEKLQVTEFVGNWEIAAIAAPPPKKAEGADSADAAKAKKPVENPYDLFHMDMTVKGPYSNVTHFLSMLNKFPKIVAIEKCDVQPDDQFSRSSSIGYVVARVKMTGFAFKAEEKNLPSSPSDSATNAPSTSGNPLLPGNGASSKARGAQNDVINSSSTQPGASNSGSSNSGSPGVPRPTQVP